MLKACPSRRHNRPVTWSTSPLVRITACMGLLRTGPFLWGWSSLVSNICWRMSGEAFNSTQSFSFALTAMDDWLLGATNSWPPRASFELGALQFHCGKPPPAPDPRTFIFILGVSP